MKKLLIAMGCVAAIVLSSCTSDTIDETKDFTNKNNPEILSVEIIDSLNVTNSTGLYNGDDNKDKTKG
ncbi:hypothetical protein QLS91_09720 [Flavobacterium sp. LB2P84]|uniref:Uncharacterized protein n=1 Tax=Flavobacterium yafengii TaxID=3041253 RepID=A0AAW6TT81_9FLAO|nr:hypothetical protein [Flavobacterium yafengii]MDI5950267.1 hypothetical protein [Flavobacterium yafengii]MDI6033350.1 hypothetical protein [Flavobacterium yafengii]